MSKRTWEVSDYRRIHRGYHLHVYQTGLGPTQRWVWTVGTPSEGLVANGEASAARQGKLYARRAAERLNRGKVPHLPQVRRAARRGA